MEIYRVGKVLFDRSARLDGTLEGGGLQGPVRDVFFLGRNLNRQLTCCKLYFVVCFTRIILTLGHLESSLDLKRQFKVF